MSKISDLKVDAHQHFWKYDPEKYSWITEEMSEIKRDFLPADLKPLLHENNFDVCIAVQAEQSEEETVRLLEYANAYNFVKGVVGWLDLTSKNVEERLELYSRDPAFKGVRHTVWDKKGEFMRDQGFRRGIAALGKFRLTYDILAFDYQLPEAVKLVQDFPGQRFILNHIGNPELQGLPSESWLQHISEIAANSNVFCKISGLGTLAKKFGRKKHELEPYLDAIMDSFGAERLIFGSNWPVCLTAASYSEVIKTTENYFQQFSEAEKNGIFGKNAAEFYNLR